MRDLLTSPALSELLELRLPARHAEPPSSWCRPPVTNMLLAAGSPGVQPALCPCAYKLLLLARARCCLSEPLMQMRGLTQELCPAWKVGAVGDGRNGAG